MTDVERPLESDYFSHHQGDHGPPINVVNQIFQPDSMETFRSSPEHKSGPHKNNLSSKLERESRRQKKDQDRVRLHQEVKDRLYDELRMHESIQSQLHGVRDSISKKRSYIDKAEQELKDLEKMISEESLKEEKLAKEFAKLQVEFTAYQSKMEGAELELQRARDLTEELTTDRNNAKKEVLEMREERLRAAEQRRLDAARREGMMQGKLEGMYAGWEDGKIMGYREGRKTGAHIQHEEMRHKDWKALQRELPEYDRFEERIPSPISTFEGEVPDPLRRLPAPIILPPAPAPKKTRRPAPPPEIVYHNEDTIRQPRPVHSSPETIEESLPPVSLPPVSQPPTRSQRQTYQTHPISAPRSREEEEEEPRPRSRNRPRTNIPPPRPIFPSEESTWEPPPSRPETLQRSATQRAIGAIGGKIKRKREDIVPAPEEMDFAPFAAQLPRMAMATPLPQSQTLMPGRAIATPAPSVHRGQERPRSRYRDRDANSEEEFDEYIQRQREQLQQQERERGPLQNPSFLSRLNSVIRGGPSRPPVDPSAHPLAYQDVQQTPHMSRLESMEPSPSPSPRRSPSIGPGDVPAPIPVWNPPPSPRHPRPAFQDIFVPSLDAQGKFSLPPPHEMEGSAMEGAISQHPSRNPSPSPSNRSGRSEQRSRSQEFGRERDRSPGRLSHLGGSIKHTASAVLHAMPSRSKIRDEFRGRSRGNSPARTESPEPIDIARERSRSRDRSRSPIRPRSGMGLPDTFVDVPEHGLLRPEHIRVGPSVSGTTISEMVDNNTRGRTPNRQGTGMSYISERNSPGGISRMSILSNGALGLSRDPYDANFVTYPNASTTNLSMMDGDRGRRNSYNPVAGPGFPQPVHNNEFAPADFFPPRPPGAQRQYSDASIQDYNNTGRAPWDENSRFPPAPPSIRSMASGPPPQPPAKSPRSSSHPHPWSQRPVPNKVVMPPLLGGSNGQFPSPAPSSRGGFAGIGAGGGIHKRALSASAMSPAVGHNFDNHSTTRLSVAGSFAGSDSGRPPIAPKPHPPSRRNPIILDDPLPDVAPPQPHGAPRSWSGEKQQISRTIPSRSRHNSTAVRPTDLMGGTPLVTVEERSPYMQNPEGRRSTGSLLSVHSNRLQNDPAYAIESDLTAALEQEVEPIRPPSDEGPPKVARPSMGKRVSKVLKFGKKGK